MTRIFGALVLLLVVSLSWVAPGSAQAQDYSLYFTDELMGPSGTTINVQCLLDIGPGVTELAGWSFGICHDFTQVQPIAVTSGATTLVANNGTPSDFDQITFAAGDAVNSGGVVSAVVICITSCATLGSGSGYEILNVEYDLVGPNGTDAVVSYCETVEIPGQPFPAVTVVANGQAVVPVQTPGTITIDVVPFELFFGTAPPTPAGDAVTVPVQLTNSQPVYGFSYGVEHDPAALAVTAVEEGAALAALNGGTGADFFVADLAPTGGTGFTLGSVFSLTGLVTLDPGSYEIATATYDVLGSAPIGDTTLNFVGTLSPPAPAPPVGIRVSTGEASVTPTIAPGFVTIEQGGALFLRGDSNDTGSIDISDAISLLDYLFSQGPTPPCLDAGDFDNSGGVDVADAISQLAFLFSGGPNPAAPYPDCGVDAEGDADGITCLAPTGCL